MLRPKFLVSLAGLAAAFAPANATAEQYRAQPGTAPADGRIIVHEIAWTCAGGVCLAPRSGTSTDATMCAAFARSLGPVTAFSAGDRGFDATALEKCNRASQPRR